MSETATLTKLKGIAEGARQFEQAIDQASGTTAAERRAELDERIDKGKCPTCGRLLP